MTTNVKQGRSVTLLDKHRFITAMAEDPDLIPSALKVGIRLVDHFNTTTRRCDPSVRRLAEATNLSERAVRHALRALEERRWITTHRNAGAAACNAYEPNFARIHENPPPPPPLKSIATSQASECRDNRKAASAKPVNNISKEIFKPHVSRVSQTQKVNAARKRAEEDLVRQFSGDREAYDFLLRFPSEVMERACDDMAQNRLPAWKVLKNLKEGRYDDMP